MDFEDYPGRFPNHCHLLDHEDHEMMRQFQTTNDPANCNNNGTCDPGEDCVSCANDCAHVSGASCGNGLCEAGDGEDCVTCPADCGGKQNGSVSNQFCCGFDDGQVTNPVGCGADANDNRCIDASAGLACRVTARLSASCGDSLCEGQEQVQGNNPDTYCQVDCDPNACQATEPGTEITCDDGQDNDCDGLIDAADPDCFDSDGDGLADGYEDKITKTRTDSVDTDKDGLVDGNSGVVLVEDYPVGPDYPDPVNADGDLFVDGEQTLGTDPTKADSDGDLLDDGLEVANGADPLDPASWPNLADGDCGPYEDGEPNGQTDAGDLVVALRIALGTLQARPRELAHCDLALPYGVIDVADILLLIQLLQAP